MGALFRCLVFIGLIGIVGIGCNRPIPEEEHHSQSRRDVTLTYRFTISGIPLASRQLAVWVPVPPSNAHQRLVDYTVTGDWTYSLQKEMEYGNRFLTFDLAGALPVAGGSVTIAVDYRLSRLSYRIDTTGTTLTAESEERLSRFLAPDRLVPASQIISDEASQIAGDCAHPITVCRRFYDHLLETFVYDKSGTGWGRGDALYACDVRAGNCTDFHSLFIAYTRSTGIPARFIMGLPLPRDRSHGAIPGYHCWAEFWDPASGWAPVDISEAYNNPDSREIFFGGLDADRIEFTVGRDIQLPGAVEKSLNFVIFPHVEINGKTHTAVQTEFSFRNTF